MKQYLSFMFLAALLVSSCAKDVVVEERPITSDFLKFTAAFEQDESRAYVEDGKFLRWTEGDQITLFVGNTLNRKYMFDGETGDNGGTFSIVENPFGTGNDLNCHYAVYPYNKDIKITEAGVITATIPTEQSYAENSFGLGANTMVAVTESVDDTFLKFRNVSGYLELQLYGNDVTVKSIILSGNNEEKLAGKATITTVYGQEPTIVMADDATTSITLNCGDGVKIGTTEETATAFWIVVPPTTFEDGLTVAITEIDGETFTKSTSNAVVVERNIIKPMAAFEVEIEKIPNNQIWYTSIDGNVVNPFRTDAFGATIVSNTYENGKGIITFDGDVTTIGYNAFGHCRELISVNIPNGVTTIGDGAFYYCTSLTNVIIPDSVNSIEHNAFGDCRELISVNIPNGVTTIGNGAFSYCTSLTNVIIPDSVTSIGNYAFGGCSALTNIEVEQGNSVYDSRDNCNAIIETKTNKLIKGCDTTIIPNSVTEIGTQAFLECINLREIIIPEGVITISDVAFLSCTALTSISIPSSVTNILGPPCHICLSLTNIEVDQDNPVYDSRENCNAIIESKTNKLIQGSNTTIIPNSVTEIGRFSFMGRVISEITIPSSVTTIGESAFVGCSQLTTVNVLATIPPTIYSDTFSNGGSDMKIYVPAGSLETYKAADYWKDLNIIENEVPIVNCISAGYLESLIGSKYPEPYQLSALQILGNLNGTDICYLRKMAGRKEDGTATSGKLTYLDLTEANIVAGGDYYYMPKSGTQYYTENNVAGDFMFYFCNLETIKFPSTITKLGNSVCSHLPQPDGNEDVADDHIGTFKSIIIPKGVTSIGKYAFAWNQNLTSIDIPNTVTDLGNGYPAFYRCDALTTLNIPDSVEYCPNFTACFGLKYIRLSENPKFTYIGAAFIGCKSLTYLTIPANIKTISSDAFGNSYNPSALTEIYFKSTTPPSLHAKSGLPTNCKIYVPKGCYSTYKVAETFMNYTIIEE